MDAMLRALQGEVEGPQMAHMGKLSITATSLQWTSLWTVAGQPGAQGGVGNTSPGVICTNNTPGALYLPNWPAGVRRWMSRLAAENTGASNMLMLYDRLWHAGPFDFQNQNVPVNVNGPIITRGPYEGVELVAEMLGAGTVTTSRNVTLNIEDDQGVAQNVTFSPPSDAAIGRVQQITNYPSGMHGIRRVNTVTSTQGVLAGSYNLALIRPLVLFDGNSSGVDKDFFDSGGVELLPGACLSVIVYSGSGTTGSGQTTLGVQTVSGT